MSNKRKPQWKGASKAERRKAAKDKIKVAYTDSAEVEVIPATRDLTADEPKILRVAAYCRVSTDQEAQAGSYELQVQYYTDLIHKNPAWEFVDIYADEGISGTNIMHRKEFQRMIADCVAGKIDLIITKSISRFARNTLDCLSHARQLKQLTPPVAIFFENEGINTTDRNTEAMLALLSSVAQGESENKSEAIKWACRNRFSRGIPLTPTWALLGYDKDEDGNMVIVEDEAEVVRLIYESYISGENCREIAERLTSLGIPTVKGLKAWPPGSVYCILRNEKYFGDVLMQKTVTPDCLSHRSIKNTGQERQYVMHDHHPAIVSEADWRLVQKLLKTRRFEQRRKVKPPPPPLTLVWSRRGKTKGFLELDPSWKARNMEEVRAGIAAHNNKRMRG